MNIITITLAILPFFSNADTVLFSSISDLPLDDKGHLESQWLLFPIGKCGDKILSSWNANDMAVRKVAYVSDDLAASLFGYDGHDCSAVCLERGVPSSYIKYPLPEQIYHEGHDDLVNWLNERCQALELGFVSYEENPLKVYWISPDGSRYELATMEKGERHTFWTNTRLGHEFEIVDSVTQEVLGRYVAEYNAFYPIGDSGTFVGTEVGNEEAGVNGNFMSEFYRHDRVKRTFTELGFSKGRLPEDVWGSMQAYYYNNQNNACREEYENKGFTVNWYQVDPLFIGMPWGLKGYWQTRLRALVEKWIGGNVPLENTDIYGIRKYQDGARLLTHVDREATHAVSLIINIAQSQMRQPWMVEIYDFADRLHEIEMEPGDIVYYESARCLHGRMRPLQGAHYVNLFTHYRPVGDPQWFLKPNPEGTPEPLISLEGECDEVPNMHTGVPETVCEPPIQLPTLSPSNHVVQSAGDLLQYWKDVSPAGSSHSSEL